MFNKDKIINLDNNNRIVVIKDINKYENIMIHERLINGKYTEINRWITKIPWYNNSNSAIISKLNIFQVENDDGKYNAWYDYINDNFVIPLNIYDEIYTGLNNEYIDKYNACIGIFTIKSDFEEDDIFSYKNGINDQKILHYFEVKDGKYFVILNLDGSIRGNRIFKGQSLFTIREAINILEYSSLKEFMKRKKDICNIIKAERKKMYYNSIKERNNDDYSPYLDGEIKRVLNLKR